MNTSSGYVPEYSLNKDAFVGTGGFHENALEALANMALEEIWDFKNEKYKDKKGSKYPVLNNYLYFTYDRLKSEGKIAYSKDNQSMCFNTGLQTRHYEMDIYAYFEINNRYPKVTKKQWYFIKFCDESDSKLTSFIRLPDIAEYCENPQDLIFDKRLNIRFFYDHIVNENIERFKDVNLDYDPSRLKDILIAAAQRTEKRVRRNYKIAIPQVYNDKNTNSSKMQLLLPLCLNDKDKADLALVISKEGETYLAKTVLPLDWAYMNSRRIVTPNAEWITKEI